MRQARAAMTSMANLAPWVVYQRTLDLALVRKTKVRGDGRKRGTLRKPSDVLFLKQITVRRCCFGPSV